MKTRRGEGVKGDNRKTQEGKRRGEGGGVREGEDATKRRMECRTEAYIDTLPAGQADLQLISIVLYNTLAPEDSARTSALQEPVQFNKYATEVKLQHHLYRHQKDFFDLAMQKFQHQSD